jgi:hypothetical protein
MTTANTVLMIYTQDHAFSTLRPVDLDKLIARAKPQLLDREENGEATETIKKWLNLADRLLARDAEKHSRPARGPDPGENRENDGAFALTD